MFAQQNHSILRGLKDRNNITANAHKQTKIKKLKAYITSYFKSRIKQAVSLYSLDILGRLFFYF